MTSPTGVADVFPEIAAAARILILAPHPDDESIATGGLIQHARAAGAALRVVVLTDGDANVWPQRFIEKRWRIDATARARWGARRRDEARAAMRVLGLHEDEAEFFALPDLGLTDYLMRGDDAILARLRTSIRTFAPTHLVLPTLSDRHPDHSATHVLARLALRDSAAPQPNLLGFAVHGGLAGGVPVALHLHPEQQQRKRDAIVSHASQMRLSRKRFLRHVRPAEDFHALPPTAQELVPHPLRARADAQGRLHLEFDRRQWGASPRGMVWFVVFDGASPRRLYVAWKSGATALPIIDSASGECVGDARVAHTEAGLALDLDTGASGWTQGFVKLARPVPGLWVFDRFGWQTILPS